jgi:hypothetical protein
MMTVVLPGFQRPFFEQLYLVTLAFQHGFRLFRYQ